jgi:hypothetical protein
MVVNRLQKGLINLRIAPRASSPNCQNILFQMGIHIFFLLIVIEIFIMKRIMYHKYNLHTKN